MLKSGISWSTEDAIKTMEICIKDIRHWMATNFLLLNDNKTELLIIGTAQMLKKLPPIHLTVGNDSIAPSETARNIGAYLTVTYQCPVTFQTCAKVHGISLGKLEISDNILIHL